MVEVQHWGARIGTNRSICSCQCIQATSGSEVASGMFRSAPPYRSGSHSCVNMSLFGDILQTKKEIHASELFRVTIQHWSSNNLDYIRASDDKA